MRYTGAMGFRFQKRLKIFPGLSINIGKSGVSASIGAPGAHVTVGHGQVRETVGIPGTGLSYTNVSTIAEPAAPAPSKPHRGWLRWAVIVLLLLLIAAAALFALHRA